MSERLIEKKKKPKVDSFKQNHFVFYLLVTGSPMGLVLYGIDPSDGIEGR